MFLSLSYLWQIVCALLVLYILSSVVAGVRRCRTERLHLKTETESSLRNIVCSKHKQDNGYCSETQ
jgi:hypothetical protein